MDCGRPSDRVRFISLISISGLHFHFHLLGSLLAISPFICSPLLSPRLAVNGLLGQVGVLSLTGASVCQMKRRRRPAGGEEEGRVWGGGGGGGYHRGGRGHFTLMTSAGRNPPLDSGSVWKCARGLRRVALCVRASASHL